MSTPIYRSKKFLNTVASTLGILTIVIFVAANMLSIHAYNIHPTATQTLTPTPTITNTPRPSNTPTITTTATSTSTPTATPTFLPEYAQIIDIIYELSENGYTCSVIQSAESNLGLDCSLVKEETLIKYRLILSDGILIKQQILLEPLSVPLSENISNEVILIAQIPLKHIWLSDLKQSMISLESEIETSIPSESITPQISSEEIITTTPTITPTADSVLMNQLSRWMIISINNLTSEEDIQNSFAGYTFTIRKTGNNLYIECSLLKE